MARKKVDSKELLNKEIILVIPLLKETKMDYILQKATELGVTKIIPVEMERSIIKLDKGKEEKRIERWKRICKEASEQSMRVTIPVITEVKKLTELSDIDGAKRVVTQSFKRSSTDKDFLKSLEVNDYTKLTDAFIKELPECIREKIMSTYEEQMYMHGITNKILITDTLKEILPKEKNYLYNLNDINKTADLLNKILSYILEEFYEKNFNVFVEESNLMRKNSIVYLIFIAYNLIKLNIKEEKFLMFAEKILLSSATWDRETLSKKKTNIKNLIEEAKEIMEEILND